MTWQKRFMWAGLGGFALVLVNIWAVDAKTMFVNIHLDRVLAGYIVNSALLVILAGVFGGIIHEDEIKIPKLIQLGVSIPAILSQIFIGAHSPKQTTYIPLESVAYASEAEERPDSRVKDFTKAAEEIDSFVTGLTRTATDNTLYLI